MRSHFSNASQPVTISGIHHIALICSDYEVSKQFYTVILGFGIIAETYRKERNSYKLDLAVPGGGQIELFSIPGSPQRPSYPEACGLRHLALRVKDLDSSVNGLTNCGIPVEEIRLDPLTDKRFTFFPDPDGLPIELYEEILS